MAQKTFCLERADSRTKYSYAAAEARMPATERSIVNRESIRIRLIYSNRIQCKTRRAYIYTASALGTSLRAEVCGTFPLVIQ